MQCNEFQCLMQYTKPYNPLHNATQIKNNTTNKHNKMHYTMQCHTSKIQINMIQSIQNAIQYITHYNAIHNATQYITQCNTIQNNTIHNATQQHTMQYKKIQYKMQHNTIQ